MCTASQPQNAYPLIGKGSKICAVRIKFFLVISLFCLFVGAPQRSLTNTILDLFVRCQLYQVSLEIPVRSRRCQRRVQCVYDINSVMAMHKQAVK